MKSQKHSHLHGTGFPLGSRVSGLTEQEFCFGLPPCLFSFMCMLQTVIRLRRRHHDSGGFWLNVRRGLAWPLQKLGQLAHVVLSKALLLSCEVALEYMLALTYSPQVRASAAKPASLVAIMCNAYDSAILGMHGVAEVMC